MSLCISLQSSVRKGISPVWERESVQCEKGNQSSVRKGISPVWERESVQLNQCYSNEPKAMWTDYKKITVPDPFFNIHSQPITEIVINKCFIVIPILSCLFNWCMQMFVEWVRPFRNRNCHFYPVHILYLVCFSRYY